MIQITDQCPECESNHLDVQALTWAKVRRYGDVCSFPLEWVCFALMVSAVPVSRAVQACTRHIGKEADVSLQIANPSPNGGRVNIQYRRVQCVPPSNLFVSVDNNLGDGAWIRLQITVS